MKQKLKDRNLLQSMISNVAMFSSRGRWGGGGQQGQEHEGVGDGRGEEMREEIA